MPSSLFSPSCADAVNIAPEVDFGDYYRRLRRYIAQPRYLPEHSSLVIILALI